MTADASSDRFVASLIRGWFLEREMEEYNTRVTVSVVKSRPGTMQPFVKRMINKLKQKTGKLN